MEKAKIVILYKTNYLFSLDLCLSLCIVLFVSVFLYSTLLYISVSVCVPVISPFPFSLSLSLSLSLENLLTYYLNIDRPSYNYRICLFHSINQSYHTKPCSIQTHPLSLHPLFFPFPIYPILTSLIFSTSTSLSNPLVPPYLTFALPSRLHSPFSAFYSFPLLTLFRLRLLLLLIFQLPLSSLLHYLLATPHPSTLLYLVLPRLIPSRHVASYADNV